MSEVYDFPGYDVFHHDDEEEERIKSDCKVRSEVEYAIDDLIEKVIYEENEPVLERGIISRCVSCNHDIFSIGARGGNDYEHPPDYLNETTCRCMSCTYDGIKCIDCGLSEKLIKCTRDRNVRFHLDEETFPEVYRCETCWWPEDGYDVFGQDASGAYHDLIYGEGEEVDESERNMREFYLNYINPNHESCPYCHEDHPPWHCHTGLWDTYRDEFMIDTEGDQELLEDDDSEDEEDEGEEVIKMKVGDVKEVKDALKVAMDLLFEFSESLSEGRLLENSDILKRAYEKLK